MCQTNSGYYPSNDDGWGEELLLFLCWDRTLSINNQHLSFNARVSIKLFFNLI